MKYSKVYALLVLVLASACREEQNIVPKKWFKGNLHTHSYWSDGDEFPEVIMDWYKSNNYQFVALTDHNTLAEGDRWKVISSDSMYQRAFADYLDAYGADWVNYRKDALNRVEVKLKTYQEYKGRFEEKENFLIIQSEEITDGFDGKPLHLNATNVSKKINPQGGNSVMQTLQNNIDEVIKQRNELNKPMMVHINHPNFGYAVTLEDMIGLRNERFFEVYNGHQDVHNMGDESHLSTESMWDYINIAYLENDKPLMFGIATDDSHHYHEKGRKWANSGRGWVTVRADSLHPKALINAMESGDFYASTGVELKDLSSTNKKLSVEVKQEQGVTYKIAFIGCKKGNTSTEALAVSTGNTASFDITEDVLFVRCKITSSKLQDNPIEDLIYETAWTQPILGDKKGQVNN